MSPVGHAFEEAALRRTRFAVAERGLVAHGLRQVENDRRAGPASAREQLDEQRAVAAADVDDRLVTAPVERGEPLDAPLRAPRCIARSKALAPRGWSASHDQKSCRTSRGKPSRRRRRDGDGAVPDAAEQLREVVPAGVPREELGAGVLRKTPGSSSAKTPSLASARRRRSSVSASAPASRASSATATRARRRAPRRRRARPTIPRLACRARRAEVPEHCLGRALAHPRARATAAATSSTSSSASVRQSSSGRPSRTTPTTGGSPSAQRRRELLLDRAREARQLGERQRAAADAARRSPRPRRRRARRAVRRGRALPRAGSSSIRSTGISRARGRGRGRARAFPRARPA